MFIAALGLPRPADVPNQRLREDRSHNAVRIVRHQFRMGVRSHRSAAEMADSAGLGLSTPVAHDLGGQLVTRQFGSSNHEVPLSNPILARLTEVYFDLVQASFDVVKALLDAGKAFRNRLL